MIKNQKKQIVNKLTENFQNNKYYLVLSYQNLSTKAIDNLKKDLKKTKTKLTFVKNSLLEKALNLLGIKDKNYQKAKKQLSPLKNPTALAFFSDENQWLNGLKIFYKFINTQKNLQFRLGFIENNLYQANELSQLAVLPGKDELLGKIIGSLKNPLQKFIYNINNPIQKLVYILSQKSKEGGESK